MNAKEIYDHLIAGGLTRAGALGMLGNMMAESSLRSNIAQRGMTNLSDAEYTRQADEGLLDFTRPVGYGLCQWTEKSRKRKLLAYAKEMGVSVGNGPMQCYFAIKELKEDFPAVYKTLCSSNSIDECTDLVCARYEMPAVNKFAARRNYAYTFEKDIPEEEQSYVSPKKDPIKATFPPDPSVKQIQYVMWDNGYWPIEKINGYKSKEFFNKLKEFVKDMESC